MLTGGLDEMRDPREMHYYLWEAIRDQAKDMVRLGLIPRGLNEDVDFIDGALKRQGGFNGILSKMACRIEDKLKPGEGEWQRLINEECLASINEDRGVFGYAIEMHGFDI